MFLLKTFKTLININLQARQLTMNHKQFLFTYFQKLWTFDRKIESLSDGSLIGSVCNGIASFCDWKDPNNLTEPRLLYREKGELSTDGTWQDFTRQYMYKFPSSGMVQVYHCSVVERRAQHLDPVNLIRVDFNNFMEKEFFHDLELDQDCKSIDSRTKFRKITASWKHYCDPDMYDGKLEIESENAFRMLWKVTGPKKLYSITTTYQTLS